MKTSRYKEKKLQFLLELLELDHNLLLLAAVLGSKDFGKVLKTFAGYTIKFPSVEEIRKIGKGVESYRKSFKKILQTEGRGTSIGHLAQIGVMIDNPDVRKATKARLTLAVFQEYIRSIFEDPTFEMTIDELRQIDITDKIKLYELQLKDLSLRTNMFNSIYKLKNTNIS